MRSLKLIGFFLLLVLLVGSVHADEQKYFVYGDSDGNIKILETNQKKPNDLALSSVHNDNKFKDGMTFDQLNAEQAEIFPKHSTNFVRQLNILTLERSSTELLANSGIQPRVSSVTPTSDASKDSENQLRITKAVDGVTYTIVQQDEIQYLLDAKDNLLGVGKVSSGNVEYVDPVLLADLKFNEEGKVFYQVDSESFEVVDFSIENDKSTALFANGAGSLSIKSLGQGTVKSDYRVITFSDTDKDTSTTIIQGLTSANQVDKDKEISVKKTGDKYDLALKTKLGAFDVDTYDGYTLSSNYDDEVKALDVFSRAQQLGAYDNYQITEDGDYKMTSLGGQSWIPGFGAGDAKPVDVYYKEDTDTLYRVVEEYAGGIGQNYIRGIDTEGKEFHIISKHGDLLAYEGEDPANFELSDDEQAIYYDSSNERWVSKEGDQTRASWTTNDQGNVDRIYFSGNNYLSYNDDGVLTYGDDELTITKDINGDIKKIKVKGGDVIYDKNKDRSSEELSDEDVADIQAGLDGAAQKHTQDKLAEEEERRGNKRKPVIANLYSTVMDAAKYGKGWGGYSSLFYDDEELTEWRNGVDEVFASAYLGSEYWVSNICEAKLDVEGGQQVAFGYGPDPFDATGGVFVTATCSGTKQQVGNNITGVEYLYKIEYFVRNPSDTRQTDEEDEINAKVRFNVLVGENEIFEEDIFLGQGERSYRAGSSAIVEYSNQNFDMCCVNIKSGPTLGVGSNPTCNRIEDLSSARGTPAPVQEVDEEQEEEDDQ